MCEVHIIYCIPFASVPFFYCKSGPVMCCSQLFSAFGYFCVRYAWAKEDKIVCLIVGKRLFLIKWRICGKLWFKRERFFVCNIIKCNKWHVFHFFHCSSRIKQVCICLVSLINDFKLKSSTLRCVLHRQAFF